MPVATHAVLAVNASIRNENPVKKRKIDIKGNVTSKRLRRPKVSIV